MTPYVIDKQKQLTIYILFVLAIIISFGLGVVFGYQMTNLKSIILPASITEQSKVDNPATDETDTKELVEDEKKPVSDTGEQKNNKSAEKSQAQKQEKKSQAKKTSDKSLVKTTQTKKTSSTTSKTSSTQTNKTVNSTSQDKKTVVKSDVTQKPASKPLATNQPQQITASTPDNQNADQPAVVSSDDMASIQDDTGENKKRYYSVQAGLFASQKNATKFLDELLSNGFDAYVQDFVSSSGVVKYNVRFGRSDNRETTRKRLAEFRQAFTTPAYVVIGN